MSTGRLGHGLSRLAVLRLGALTEDSGEILRSVSSDLALTSMVAVNAAEQNESSTITFVDAASAVVDRVISVTTVMTLVDALGQIFEETVSSPITFTSDVVSATEYWRGVSDAITFAQDVRQNLYFGIAESELEFAQSTGIIGPQYEYINSNLGLVQDVIGHLSVTNQFVAHEIVFEQQAGRVLEQSVTSAITFVSEGVRRTLAIDTITFVQSAEHGKGGDVESAISFVSSVAYDAVFNRSLSDTLTLVSSATYILFRGCTEKEYTPFVGSGSNEFTPPPTTAPTLGSATLTLTYPYAAPTTTLVLRNPEFRNTDTLNFNRINRTTRGGTLIVFADPDWPKTQTLRVECAMLKREQADDLLDFFLESLGKEIGFLDHENRQWRGIITTPDAEVAHTSRHNRTVSFDFEGELV